MAKARLVLMVRCYNIIGEMKASDPAAKL